MLCGVVGGKSRRIFRKRTNPRAPANLLGPVYSYFFAGAQDCARCWSHHRHQAALERRSRETRDGEGKEGVRRRAELSVSSNTPNMAEVGRAFRGLRRIPVRVRAANCVDMFDRPTRQQHSPQGRGIEHAVLYAIVSWAPMKTLLCVCTGACLQRHTTCSRQHVSR